MDRIWTSSGNGSQTADGDYAIVLRASPAINHEYVCQENSSPDLAALLIDTFAEAVSDFVRKLEKMGIYLEPSGYDLSDDMMMISKASEFGIDLKAAVGRVIVGPDGLSMLLTGNHESVSRMIAMKRSMEASFGLIMTSHFFRFAVEVSKS